MQKSEICDALKNLSVQKLMEMNDKEKLRGLIDQNGDLILADIPKMKSIVSMKRR